MRNAKGMSERSASLSSRFSYEENGFNRSLSFFDAICGFAATLLVTNIELPPPSAWVSVGSLLASGVGDQLLAFTISFVVIAVFWWAGVKQAQTFNATTGVITASTLLTAGLIILLPFTTQGISDPEFDYLPLPTALYSLNVALAALSQILTGYLARRAGVISHPVSPRVYRIQFLDALTTPLYFLLTVPVAFLVGANTAQLLWLGLIIVGPASAQLARRAIRKAH